ncbi:hypothetical protein V2J09_009066 [Rumex salicifolius]
MCLSSSSSSQYAAIAREGFKERAMDVLEVDVNGEGLFMVDKNIICSYSGRLKKLFGKSENTKGNNLKVIFNDFPGGVEGFELVARFCYSNDRNVYINPLNISLLHRAARFMEIDKSVTGAENLVEQIDKSLEAMNYNSWSDLLMALKQSQRLTLESSEELIEKFLDTLVVKLTLASAEPSPCRSASSPESFTGFRISCDSRSNESIKTSCSRVSWWAEELVSLDLDLVHMIVRSMISRKFNHAWIARFILYYQKAKLVDAKVEDKCKIMEKVMSMLSSLDPGSVSLKGLFSLLRFARKLNMNKQSQAKLEGMIGLRLDEASLDNLLVPAPFGVNSLYDVNLVLRLLRSFWNGGICEVTRDQMKKVADLVDLFLAEVAPDPCLKTSKLIALAMALPDSARDSYNDIYHAVDMYLEVHPGLSEEERLNICCVLNYEKLSSESCFHLAQNKKFPSRSAVQALICQQGKFKDVLQDEHHTPKSVYANAHRAKGEGRGGKVVLFARKPDTVMPENEKLKAQVQAMQWRVNELEKVCKKMQTQMTKIRKSSKPSNGNQSRSLPKLYMQKRQCKDVDICMCKSQGETVELLNFVSSVIGSLVKVWSFSCCSSGPSDSSMQLQS